MKTTTKRILATLSALTLTASLAACGGSSSSTATGESASSAAATATTKDTLVVAEETDCGTMAPVGSTIDCRTDIANQVYNGLFRYGYNMEIEPQLATSWEEVDSTHYVFHLREGVKYHDGRDFTAKDVLFSLELAYNDASSNAIATYLDLENCKIIDDYTVELAFTQQNAFNFSKLDALNIVNEEAYNESGDGFATHPIGTGPYKFESSVPGSTYTFTAFDEYWGEAPAIKNLTLMVIPEASQRTTSLQTGEVDINMVLQTSDYEYMSTQEGFAVGGKPGYNSETLFFNMTENSPFQEKALRQAVCYVVDNEAMNEAAFGGYSYPNTTVWSSGMNDYDETWTSPMYGEPDFEKAQELVDSVGAPTEPITILYGGMYQEEIMAQILQANLAKIGITAEVVSVDQGVLWSSMADPTAYDIGIMGCSAPSGYGLDSMTAFLTGLNFQGWSGENYDKVVELCNAGASAATDEERMQYTKELHDLIVEEVPLYGMVTINKMYAYNASLNFDIFGQYSFRACDLAFSG